MNIIEKDQQENNLYIQQENSPYLQFLMLLAFCILGFIVSSILAVVFVYALYGADTLSSMMSLSSGGTVNRGALQILLIVTSLGFFLVPPLLLSITEKKNPVAFYGLRRPDFKLFGVVFLIMLVSMPIMELTAMLNQKMVLPELLKPIEEWMKSKEDEAMQTTLLLLKMTSIKDFLMNLFMIALLPAVAEELMFRGGVQRTFTRWFNNPHVAIWTSAIIFSAIHMQFYGFVPRLLLGAGFGYIYYFSGNLWYAMLGHFLNNAYAVCAAWYMQKNNIPLSATDSPINIAWYGYIISFILTVMIFIYFKDLSKKEYYERRMD
ncbi:MAG TPA: CPBP family intramembrane metalloprotease domain-containing protein [Chitinophagaceae bacterium]|nr:CPBP family intramembrane metalloprotease domain-containing protein [Chitinophagaceae bacterium]